MIALRRARTPNTSVASCHGRIRITHHGITLTGHGVLWVDRLSDQWGGFVDTNDLAWLPYILRQDTIHATCGILRRNLGAAVITNTLNTTIRRTRPTRRIIMVGVGGPPAWFARHITRSEVQ